MKNHIIPQPGIMDIMLYAGGKTHIDGIDNLERVIKLSSNENPHGPSPKAQAAFIATADHLALYPSNDHTALRMALAQQHNLDINQIICGNGSDEFITLLCQAYAGFDHEVIFTEHGFLMYQICTQVAGATPVEVKERERTTDIDSLIAACSERTKIIFIANPNNPTGTFIPLMELERLAQSIPRHCLLVLDGAYAEFEPDYDGGASLVDRYPNVVMLRSFSKAYGLGGLRIGWCYADQSVIDVLNRVRGPFNVNSAGLAAAIGALSDQEYLQYCLDENSYWGNYLISEIRALGIACDKTHTNFVLLRFVDEAQADAANAALLAMGIIARQVKRYNLPQCIRITIGKGVDCQRVIKCLSAFMETQNA